MKENRHSKGKRCFGQWINSCHLTTSEIATKITMYSSHKLPPIITQFGSVDLVKFNNSGIDFSATSGAVILCLVVCKSIQSHRISPYPCPPRFPNCNHFLLFAKANTENERKSGETRETLYHLIIYIFIKVPRSHLLQYNPACLPMG